MAAASAAAPSSLPVLLAAGPAAAQVTAQKDKLGLHKATPSPAPRPMIQAKLQHQLSESSEMHRRAKATRSAFQRPAIWASAQAAPKLLRCCRVKLRLIRGHAMADVSAAASPPLPVLLSAGPAASQMTAQKDKLGLHTGAAAPSPSPRLMPQTKLRRQQSDSSEMHRRAKATRSTFQRPAIWVMVFGWSLAMCAGFVNVVAYRSWHVFVSHMTGDTTSIGMHIEGYHAGR
eukprot:CAMPEP_0115688782 /NCGR_PEP_ID=MMETSP0272-20121206/61197_1 /TAXON_ID=71861 /ORGANISM="Scrippsiella trochoidea, Strain CCMP3099" /LENGTH=230 /DNA_ID=CAMNT_0003128499 /DNA_START=82 /DNA_END=770 /DNA_ORIENTATION=+